MIKLSASISKKMPIGGLEYSSQNYSAGLEVEIADTTEGKDIKANVMDLYALLEEAVDDQVQRQAEQRDISKGRPTQTQPHKKSSSGGNGKGNNGRKATSAQIKAIYAISRDRGVTEQELAGLMNDSYGAKDSQDLTIRQASELIDTLKNTARA